MWYTINRFAGTDIFEQIFMKVIEEIIKHGLIDEENVFIDGTHIKANANNKKHRNTIAQKSVKFYEKELQKEIEKDREEHGKKPLEDKKVFENTACRHNYILGFEAVL